VGKYRAVLLTRRATDREYLGEELGEFRPHGLGPSILPRSKGDDGEKRSSAASARAVCCAACLP
jgi:hypothetical protein